MSMRVERSSLAQVKERFNLNKRKLEEQKKEYDMEERLREIREEVRIHNGLGPTKGVKVTPVCGRCPLLVS